jgi:hypothetical protein
MCSVYASESAFWQLFSPIWASPVFILGALSSLAFAGMMAPLATAMSGGGGDCFSFRLINRYQVLTWLATTQTSFVPDFAS